MLVQKWLNVNDEIERDWRMRLNVIDEMMKWRVNNWKKKRFENEEEKLKSKEWIQNKIQKGKGSKECK